MSEYCKSCAALAEELADAQAYGRAQARRAELNIEGCQDELLARLRSLEAQNAALLADVNQDEGYERLKARNVALEAALESLIVNTDLHGHLGLHPNHPSVQRARALLPQSETFSEVGK